MRALPIPLALLAQLTLAPSGPSVLLPPLPDPRPRGSVIELGASAPGPLVAALDEAGVAIGADGKHALLALTYLREDHDVPPDAVLRAARAQLGIVPEAPVYLLALSLDAKEAWLLVPPDVFATEAGALAVERVRGTFEAALAAPSPDWKGAAAALVGLATEGPSRADETDLVKRKLQQNAGPLAVGLGALLALSGAAVALWRRRARRRPQAAGQEHP
jgi:hypothetical protein